MDPRSSPPAAPPPPPAPVARSVNRRHSTRRVVAAAVAGIAVGIAAVSLLMSTPIDGSRAAPPAVTEGATADAGVTAPQGGVVDQATAEQAALAHLGEGRVTWVSPEDDRGAAWEIEVTLPDGSEVDVLVDAAGTVIDARQGLARWLP